METEHPQENDWYSTKDVVKSYEKWLELKAPEHRSAFGNRRRVDPEAADAEAIVFSILHAKRLNPKPAEIIGTGGVDFHCRPVGRPEFVVEVTAILRETISRHSGLSGRMENRVGSFGMVTDGLFNEAIGKAKQMSGYPMPRVLFVASSHPDTSLLFGAHGATELMIGTAAFSVPLEGRAGDARLIAKLQNSVFMRRNAKGDGIEAARRSISAIVLTHITGRGADLIGLLHPYPAYPFDPSTFETVHFLAVAEWPIVSERLRLGWVGPVPASTSIVNFPIRFGRKDFLSGD